MGLRKGENAGLRKKQEADMRWQVSSTAFCTTTESWIDYRFFVQFAD